LRLLSFSFPINDYYAAAKASECPPWPEATATWLAIVRRDYLVRRIPLEEAEFQLLKAVVAGSTLQEALSASTATAKQVAQWFAGWGRLRLFCGLQTENAQ
jgi:hypothetical protein